MHRPSELHQFLRTHSLRPRKGLSQNFLIDGNILQKIIHLAAVKAEDHVLEIGPGPGALTQALLATGAQITAIEKDPVLAASLTRLQTDDHRLHVVQEDILQFPLPPQKSDKMIVVANLPYHLTTPILAKLISHPALFSSIIVMVQEEVARRMCAAHGSRVYGALSVFLQLQSAVSYGFGVSRHCFFPTPKVDSAVVRLDLVPPPVSNLTALFTLTRRAFLTRRKMLRNALAKHYGTAHVTAVLERLHLPVTARAEQLSPQDFIHLYEQLSIQPAPPHQ